MPEFLEETFDFFTTFDLIYFVITTEKDKMNAYKISNLLLEEALVPCVTFKSIESHFWWEGEINKSKEVQLIIKCKAENK